MTMILLQYRSALLLLVLLSGCTNFNQWSAYDKTVYVTSWILTVIDVGQTRYAYNHPDEFEEDNYIINSFFDSADASTLYLVGVNVGVGLIADNISPTWRTVLLSGYTVGKGYVVIKNNSIGLKLEW